jgi:hypothetical protein
MRGANILICMAGLSLGASAFAASSDSSPYQAIVERNVFALKPPPRPEDNQPPPPPPSKITLTGITTLLGNKRALLSVAVPGKQPDNLMLTEGQRDNEIEVLQIDEKAGSVKVLNHGVEQTLDFKTDGAKAQPGITSLPGVPPANVIPPPNPQGIPAPPRTIPTRTMRLPPIPGAPSAPGPNSENPPPQD